MSVDACTFFDSELPEFHFKEFEEGLRLCLIAIWNNPCESVYIKFIYRKFDYWKDVAQFQLKFTWRQWKVRMTNLSASTLLSLRNEYSDKCSLQKNKRVHFSTGLVWVRQ